MLNEKEKQLAAHWLNKASDMYSNHVCNDVEEKVWVGWTEEERQQFVKEYHEYNGNLEEYDPNFLYLPDFAIMDFLAHKLSADKNLTNEEILDGLNLVTAGGRFKELIEENERLKVEKIHHESLIECCTKLLDSIDACKISRKQIAGLRILLNKPIK